MNRTASKSNPDPAPMNGQKTGTKENLRKFAFGYYFGDRCGFTFRDLAGQYAPFLQEVYFPWPGLLSARELHGDPAPLRQQIIEDMRFCRSKGMGLDLLVNATCYGDKAFTTEQKQDFFNNLKLMEKAGILPDIITTTSPFIAVVAKQYNASFDCRASVNMRLNSTLAMEYVSREFDSFYVCRDIQRDLPTMKIFADWGKKNGKRICMLANSGCLRYCPWQTFHETLLAHTFTHIHEEMINIGMQPTLCAAIATEERYEEILRGSWIRPEDLQRYAPYVSVFKLSTREADFPDLILKAYTSGSFDGNLLQILDPGFYFFIRTKIFDNKSFPKEWSEGKIAGRCASDCTHCGKCTEVMNRILKRDPKLPDYACYTVAPPKKLKVPGC